MKRYLGFIFFIIAFVFLPAKSISAANSFVVGEIASGQNSKIGIFNNSGKLLNSFGNIGFSGGINFACGDVDGDNEDEIVVAARYGQPKIKIYSKEGKLKYPEFLAYGINYYGGLNVALGDLNSDNSDEIIISSVRGSSVIKVFNFNGEALNLGFSAFSEFFHGGVRIASGDIDRNGEDEIIAGTGEGGKSEVRVFDISGNSMAYKIFPFEPDYAGGVEVIAGDVEGDGKDEIITCQLNKGSWCKIYHYNKRKIILNEWGAFKAKTGIHAAAADMNKNGKNEIITSTNIGENVYIKAFERGEEIETAFSFNYSGSIYGGNNIDTLSDSKRDKAKVIYVDDGDTIFLDDGREIRYIGIDTPEIDDDFYFEAANRNKELLYEKVVELEYDQQRIDPHGRSLAYVYSNGDFINAKLLKEGYAKLKTFPPNTKYLDILKEKEEEAKKNKKGIWQKESNKIGKYSILNIIGGIIKMMF